MDWIHGTSFYSVSWRHRWQRLESGWVATYQILHAYNSSKKFFISKVGYDYTHWWHGKSYARDLACHTNCQNYCPYGRMWNSRRGRIEDFLILGRAVGLPQWDNFFKTPKTTTKPFRKLLESLENAYSIQPSIRSAIDMSELKLTILLRLGDKATNSGNYVHGC